MNKVKTTQIIVKPIVKEKWHGLHKLGRSKFQDTTETIQPLYDTKIGGLATGLSEEDEKRLSVAVGTSLDNHSGNEYWQEFKVKLEDKSMFFDTSIPIQELQLKVLKASKFVANSQKELDAGKWPEAKYVIYDQKDELEKEAATVGNKARAVQVFAKLSPSKKVDLLKVYGKYTENSNEDFVYTKLYEIVEADPINFVQTANMSASEIKVRALIFDLEKKGIFRRKGTAYLYNDQQVGFDYEDTVDHLLDPKSQELLVKLKTTLEARI